MDTRPLIALLLLTSLVSVALAGQEKGSIWQERTEAGEEARKKRQYDEAAKQFELALREAESFGPRDQRLFQSLHNLATVYQLQRRYADAELLRVRSLTLQEGLYGPEHKAVAASLIELSELYYSQSERRSEAEQLLIRALGIQEKSHGPDSREVSFTLITLAYRQGLAGRDLEAEPLLLRALSIQEKIFGKQAPNLETVLIYLAAVRLRQNKPDEAEAFYRRVQSVLELALTRKTSGEESPNSLRARELAARSYAARLKNLTWFYGTQQRYSDAEAQYTHALKVLEQEFAPDHFSVAMVLEPYAILLRRLKRVEEAEKLEARAKAIKKPS